MLEGKLKCGICLAKDKEVILECNHMFCEECINKNLDSRVRACPLDRKKINKGDIRRLVWEGADASLACSYMSYLT